MHTETRRKGEIHRMNLTTIRLCRYYRQIRSYLPCSRRLKNHIMDEIRSNIAGFLEENPGASLAQVEARFGTPQAIAAAYVDDMDTQELLKALHIRQKITTIVTACVLIILLMWGITVLSAFIHAYGTTTGYIESYITENPTNPPK